MIPDHLRPTEHYSIQKHGPLSRAFRYADGLPAWLIERDLLLSSPLSEAKRHRLVEAAKSPTETPETLQALKNYFHATTPLHNLTGPILAQEAEGPFSDLRDRAERVELAELLPTYDTGSAEGTQTIIEYREWAEEFRIRTQVAGTVGAPPPDQEGPRESDLLSYRGARKIAESSAYMAAKKGGYKTFVTGTFSAEARERIEAGESTIQREVTRTMDALQQMYRRGWSTPDGERVEGHGEALPYCWVVEVPENESGEPNPHVHMMLGWRVDYRHFKAWAARIEAIWGNGYFHLEKIEDPLCAGAYMAKAAGYLCKAQGRADQGRVRGNRYAISSTARAPGWETVGAYHLGIMGHIIRDVWERHQQRHGAKLAKRRALHREREKVREAAKAAQQRHEKKRYPLAAKRRLEKIGAELVAVRAEIDRVPVRPSKYQVILKGQSTLHKFLGWAHAFGWQPDKRPDSHWLAEFKRQHRFRQRLRSAWGSVEELAAFVAEKTEQAADALAAWAHFETWQQEEPAPC